MKVSSRLFKPGGILIHSIDFLPTFGAIIDILVLNVDNYFIVYQLLDTNCFSHHFHAYEVSYPLLPNYVIKKHTTFLDNPTLGMNKLGSNIFCFFEVSYS